MGGKSNLTAHDGGVREGADLSTVPREPLESGIPESWEVDRPTNDSGVEQHLVAGQTETFGAMTGIAIHEISNVLHWLNMSLDVVEREVGALDHGRSNLESSLRDARMGASHITEIVRELRDLGRPLVSAPEAFDPVDALRTALRIAGRRVRERAELVEEIWPVPEVCGRKHDLVCVFLNLLLNAAQAVPAGAEASNTVTVRALVDPAGAVLFEVEDTGRGIPPELTDRIFDPYVTSRVTRGGTGLGLHVCRRIVRAMGGRIGFEPAPERGTRFWVSLPRLERE